MRSLLSTNWAAATTRKMAEGMKVPVSGQAPHAQNVVRLTASGLAFVNRPVAKARLAKLIRDNGGPFKVHVGCGRTVLDGWVNTDVTWRAKFHLDVTNPWPFARGTVSHIYADNVIEHLSLSSNRAFFHHALQALKEGGMLRLATPDVERRARCYLDEPAAALRQLERDREAGYPAHHKVDILRVLFQECGHSGGYLWDFESLSTELRRVGFGYLERQEAGCSSDVHLDGLEKRHRGIQREMELVVEARKPITS